MTVLLRAILKVANQVLCFLPNGVLNVGINVNSFTVIVACATTTFPHPTLLRLWLKPAKATQALALKIFALHYLLAKVAMAMVLQLVLVNLVALMALTRTLVMIAFPLN